MSSFNNNDVETSIDVEEVLPENSEGYGQAAQEAGNLPVAPYDSWNDPATPPSPPPAKYQD